MKKAHTDDKAPKGNRGGVSQVMPNKTPAYAGGGGVMKYSGGGLMGAKSADGTVRSISTKNTGMIHGGYNPVY